MYEIEELDEDEDLRQAVVGHRIVSIESEGETTIITLDNGKQVLCVL